MDLLATRLNIKLPLYVSPIPDPQAWAIDALNIPWENLVAYAFPPTALLPKVVQKPGPLKGYPVLHCLILDQEHNSFLLLQGVFNRHGPHRGKGP